MHRHDESERLRRAVKENNLFLVRRILGRIGDIRNTDPGPGRYTSLAWAAICAHEEIYGYLLGCGHDDDELSRDAENNTILILLAGLPLDYLNPNHMPSPRNEQAEGSAIRMAQAYYQRFPFLIDWSNVQGKTALHVAALKGNDDFVRMLCDLDADFDLPDVEGNTPLHYASAWGHISIVQLLIERGCQFAAKNNEGFTASDYAYSHNTMATLQETARLQFENNKRARRVIYAQAASRGNELRQRNEPGRTSEDATDLNLTPSSHRLRSGSGTSTSDSTTDFETPGTSTFLKGSVNRPHQSSLSSSNSSQPSVSSTHTSRSAQIKSSSSPLSPPALSKDMPPLPPKDATPRIPPSHSMQQLSSPTITFPSATPPRRNPSTDAALSPVVSRMRKRDADAIAQYMSRNRTLSGGDHTSSATSSTRSVSPVESKTKLVGRSALRPSVSAAALRMPEETSKDDISASPGQSRFRSTTIDLPGPPEANPGVTFGLSSRERLRPRETPIPGADTGGSTAPRRV